MLHKPHILLTQWFLRSILCAKANGHFSYPTGNNDWNDLQERLFMLKRVCAAEGPRDKIHQLRGVIKFDDLRFGYSTTYKKRGFGV